MIGCIDEVARRLAWLILRWLTIPGYTIFIPLSSNRQHYEIDDCLEENSHSRLHIKPYLNVVDMFFYSSRQSRCFRYSFTLDLLLRIQRMWNFCGNGYVLFSIYVTCLKSYMLIYKVFN